MTAPLPRENDVGCVAYHVRQAVSEMPEREKLFDFEAIMSIVMERAPESFTGRKSPYRVICSALSDLKNAGSIEVAKTIRGNGTNGRARSVFVRVGEIQNRWTRSRKEYVHGPGATRNHDGGWGEANRIIADMAEEAQEASPVAEAETLAPSHRTLPARLLALAVEVEALGDALDASEVEAATLRLTIAAMKLAKTSLSDYPEEALIDELRRRADARHIGNGSCVPTGS